MIPHWCNGTCGYTLRRQMLRAAKDVDYPDMDIEVLYSTPLINDGWWTCVTCPHGNGYWLRPSSAQRARWMADGTP